MSIEGSKIEIPKNPAESPKNNGADIYKEATGKEMEEMGAMEEFQEGKLIKKSEGDIENLKKQGYDFIKKEGDEEYRSELEKISEDAQKALEELKSEISGRGLGKKEISDEETQELLELGKEGIKNRFSKAETGIPERKDINSLLLEKENNN